MKRWRRLMTVLVLTGVLAAPRARAADEEGGERQPSGERAERQQAERREREERVRHEREANRLRGEAGNREEQDRPESPSEAELLEFIKSQRPEMIGRLKELRAENPEAYRRELRKVREHMQEFRELRERAPDVAEALMKAEHIERECGEVANRIRETRDPRAREEMTGQLRKMLSNVFELRLKQPELELRRLERETQEIKRVLERRREAREQIVEKRLRELTSAEREELGWW